jgi:hypothetical protein
MTCCYSLWERWEIRFQAHVLTAPLSSLLVLQNQLACDPESILASPSSASGRMSALLPNLQLHRLGSGAFSDSDLRLDGCHGIGFNEAFVYLNVIDAATMLTRMLLYF